MWRREKKSMGSVVAVEVMVEWVVEVGVGAVDMHSVDSDVTAGR